MILPDMLKHAPMFNRIDPKQGLLGLLALALLSFVFALARLYFIFCLQNLLSLSKMIMFPLYFISISQHVSRGSPWKGRWC